MPIIWARTKKSIIELLIEEGLVTRTLLASLQTVDMDGPDAPDQGQGLVPHLGAIASHSHNLAAGTGLARDFRICCR